MVFLCGNTGVAECVLAAACLASTACTVALPIETKNRGLTVRKLAHVCASGSICLA